jgi:hypothetical protein
MKMIFGTIYIDVWLVDRMRLLTNKRLAMFY